jgi:ribosomal protein S17
MMLKLKAPICALLAVSVVSFSGCVKRECTDEEREAAGADSNDDCTKFVPLRTFTADDAEERSIAWSSGTDLKIHGRVRTVSVVRGKADDTVTVAYKAQVELAQDREASVVEKTMSHLETSLIRKGDTIEVSADRGDSEAKLGAAIVVHLPPSFDANLVLDKTSSLPGDVTLSYLGNTSQLVVDMNATGADLTVADVDALRRVTINTHGDIALDGAFAVLDAAAVHTTIGDISARFAAVPDSHARLVADFGELVVTLPADGVFNLRAVGEQGVSTGNAPESCQSSQVPSPKLMKCNGGAGDLTTFDFEASQEIQLNFH